MDFLQFIGPNLEPKLPLISAILVITLIGIWRLGLFHSHQKNKLPPGKLGFPVIGESISFIKAHGQNKIGEWFEKRMRKHGPVFKTSLMGSNVIVLTGQAGNRFIFGGGDNGITAKQPASAAAVVGKNNIFDLAGPRHKLIRGAMVSFLNHESIQRYVGEMDSLVEHQLFQELNGKDCIQVVTTMKRVTFKVTCSLLFALPEGKEKEALFNDFTVALRGTWSIPLKFPGSLFRNALKARTRICKLFSGIIAKRKRQLLEDGNSHKDVITSFLTLRDEDGKPLSEEEIINNLIALMIASHDTTTVLVSLIIKQLSRDANVYNNILQEQIEVEKSRAANGGKLGWREIQMMRYTWNVAQELMRITPPVSGSFRHACRDTSFDGYDIPKGWQVLWVAAGTHMEKKFFQDPEKFEPSRFDAQTKSIPPFTYIAFGAGSRICPGAEFARIEVLLVIHHFITNYSWTEVFPDEPMVHDPLPYPAKAHPINLCPRG